MPVLFKIGSFAATNLYRLMKSTVNKVPDLAYLNLDRAKTIFYQFTPAQLVEAALKRDEGVLAESGALAVDTGDFTRALAQGPVYC